MKYEQKLITALKKIVADVLDGLPLTSIVEYGILFKTGRSVTFNYMRNTKSSKIYKIQKHVYQQDIEPSGRYMLHDDNIEREPLLGWEKGKITFNNPLVLKWSETGLYDETSWKFKLYQTLDKKGKSLSNKLKSLGFDAVVTVDNKNTSEIVQL